MKTGMVTNYHVKQELSEIKSQSTFRLHPAAAAWGKESRAGQTRLTFLLCTSKNVACSTVARCLTVTASTYFPLMLSEYNILFTMIWEDFVWHMKHDCTFYGSQDTDGNSSWQDFFANLNSVSQAPKLDSQHPSLQKLEFPKWRPNALK